MSAALIVAPEQWPHGLRCMDCDKRLTAGSAYSKRLVELDAEGDPIVEIVCLPCGLGVQRD
jgi:hypothetical protein